jgi:hypothetical protein
MKTMIFLMFSLFLITKSLIGQIDKFDYIDSDIRKLTFPSGKPISPQFSRPSLNNTKSLDNPVKLNINRFNLYQDYGNMTSLRPVTKEKQVKINVHYAPCYYMPKYPIRDTIKIKTNK